MLFILAMDVLDRIFTKAEACNILHPVGHPGVKHRCSMYADDVIVFAMPTTKEFQAIVEILRVFGSTTGLETSMDKCSIMPIHGCSERIQDIRAIMSCQVTEFPVKYLGLSLSIGKIPKGHLQLVIDKVAASIPQWQGSLLPQSSWLVLIKAVLTSIPVYILMAERMPPWAIEELNDICRHFF